MVICYDSKRINFYQHIKDQQLSLILFPHGCPADPTKLEEESKRNKDFCIQYINAFQVPVVYVNSKGPLEYMPGIMGALMKKANFTMNGLSTIYTNKVNVISTNIKKTMGIEVDLETHHLLHEIHFYGKGIIKGNWFFRMIILPSIDYMVIYYIVEENTTNKKLSS